MVDTNDLRGLAKMLGVTRDMESTRRARLVEQAANEIDRLRRESQIPPDGVIADIRRRLNTTGGEASDVRRENSE